MKPRYTINKNFVQMAGHRDRYGKQCTHVIETNKTFMVDKSPLEILDESIRSIGYDLRGAIETSKRLLGNVHCCPVLVNPIDRIVVFPTKSAKNEECVWFNPAHIKRTSSLNLKTSITYSNGKTKCIAAKLSSFNSKIKRAEQLEEMTRGSIFFTVEKTKKRFRKRQK
ncbi:competence protein ComK [Bacillus sp. FJAT-29937]|uniref:competence protein ComK n=1 Tax=Bacillus sp. FJAT-29937 TaxID=1720553 RepID=UPI001E2AC971|nr:competence protein ComK [Bacillus sp. FJAT-29937]